jgi:hypothetical protein
MVARARSAAGDAPRLVVVVDGRLSLGRDFGTGNRLGHGDLRRRRRGCGRQDWFGDHRGHLGHLGLRFDRDAFGRDAFGRDAFRRDAFGRHQLWCGLVDRCVRFDAGGGGRLGGLGRSSFLRRSLLRRLDVFGLFVTSQTITNCATFQPIGLCLDQGA